MIAIILVNWNGWEDTIGCIRSCLALENVDFRIVVCDNASGDGSVQRIMAWANGDLDVPADPRSPAPVANPRLPRGTALLDRTSAEAGDNASGAELIIVETGGNLGFAGGNNVGLRWALARGASHAWLLNNDTVVPTDALAEMTAHLEANPEIGLCGSAMIEYGNPGRLQGYAGAMDLATFSGRHLAEGLPSSDPDAALARDPLRKNEVLYPIGASMLVTDQFLREVGLMEESYFLYYEEADWALRARGKFGVAIAPRSRVFHKVGASAGSLTEGVSAFSSGLLYRSRLMLARRFGHGLSPRLTLAISNELLRALIRGRKGQVIGMLKALLGRVKVPKS